MSRPASFARSSQDKASPGPRNPPNAPKTSREDVVREAARLHYDVKRDGQMWFGKHDDWPDWLTAGTTNFIALRTIRRWADGGNKWR